MNREWLMKTVLLLAFCFVGGCFLLYAANDSLNIAAHYEKPSNEVVHVGDQIPRNMQIVGTRSDRAGTYMKLQVCPSEFSRVSDCTDVMAINPSRHPNRSVMQTDWESSFNPEQVSVTFSAKGMLPEFQFFAYVGIFLGIMSLVLGIGILVTEVSDRKTRLRVFA